MSTTPERQAAHEIDVHEGSAAPDDRGWLIALGFVVMVLVLAGLLALYILAWDGGAHT